MRHAFQQFKKDYGKHYFNEYEEYHRFKTFKIAYMQIEEMNLASEMTNGPSATFKINKFADLTPAEFKRLYLGYEAKKSPVVEEQVEPEEKLLMRSKDRAPIDWRAAGKVSPVKDQGACGSCWAFSTTGSLEGAYMIKNNEAITFSEQQLVDCSSAEGNHGCNGGLMDQAFKYLEKQGAETETSYPYAGVDQTCAQDSSKGVVKVSSYTDVTPDNEDALYTALEKQPISVAIDASAIMYYHDGVITKDYCSYKALNHGVLLTGYKVDSEYFIPYWDVKNSWGSSWGQQGYMKIEAFTGGEGTCGIAIDPSYPTI